ncbi:olfactory receptor 5V1-like [Spea bombifrons]|uniref:olfactory receptor 5V1-like n=1 Tax=Spea bombifrons TaxID=233779 RepID=UPI00234B278E|nr:olfactory receptor 5V1-like [Spea bombifrons]
MGRASLVQGHINETVVSKFLLLGLLHLSNIKPAMFGAFLVVFLMTLTGNSLIIWVIRADLRLHTPMYYFLGNLSFLEICYTSITIPNALSNILQDTIAISFAGCMTQVYLFTLCATAECILLAAMACDRYVAICRPLRYTALINRTVCVGLAAFAWMSGFINSTINTILTSRLVFCGSNSIERLYCEVQPLIRLSCGETWLNDIFAMASGAVFGVSCLLFILTSYVFIILVILRMPSRQSRHKTFSTCASHVIVVILYYGALIFMYLLPNTGSSQKVDIAVSLIYSTLTPMLNPIIYSLRNQQVKGALRAAIVGKWVLMSERLGCRRH